MLWRIYLSSAHSFQPSANPPAETEAYASNPTSASVRKVSPGHSVRKESEAYRKNGTKTAFWITSLTWHHICWTSPVTSSRLGRETEMLYRRSESETLRRRFYWGFAFRTPTSPTSNCIPSSTLQSSLTAHLVDHHCSTKAGIYPLIWLMHSNSCCLGKPHGLILTFNRFHVFFLLLY